MEINYSAPPTCAQFMRSDAFGRLIAGPVGSGKTTACIFELFRRAAEQNPGADGMRHTRFAIVRQTLEQLKMTVLKDILSWFRGIATYKVQDKTITIRMDNIVSEWILIPLDDIDDQRRLLSSQLTGAWISEAIEIDLDLVAPLSGRVGRYPSGLDGVPTWRGVIADTNMPTLETPWHRFLTDKTPPDWQIFIQPGGLTPEAENLDWLTQTEASILLPEGHPERRAQGRKYYDLLSTNGNPAWVNRYVHANFGDDPAGMAVFRESFKHSFHVQHDVQPVMGRPLIIGQDFGRNPWSIITQLDNKGRLLILEEVSAENIGLEKHLSQSLRPALWHERYQNRPSIVVGDPSGIAKDSIYEETSFDALRRGGFTAYPAPTNDIDPRLRAVEFFLMQQVDGGPAMIIDADRCPTLVRGLGGGYRFSNTKTKTLRTVPDKNEYSHAIDALQYACLAARGGDNGYVGTITSRIMRRKTPERPAFTSRAWT